MEVEMDGLYLVITLVSMALAGLAQLWVKASVSKWSAVEASRGMTGKDVAEAILRVRGVVGVTVEETPGVLSDHYDPSVRRLRLSSANYSGTSIAAAGIAAHEVGHAIQHAQSYPFMTIRQKLVPVANIGSRFAPFIIGIGLAVRMMGIAQIGVLLFAGIVAFQVVTLPVELDASSRAKKALAETGMLNDEEMKGASAVLTAAAATYIASAIGAALQLLYYIARMRRR
jgi:uncharacterized protein